MPQRRYFGHVCGTAGGRGPRRLWRCGQAAGAPTLRVFSRQGRGAVPRWAAAAGGQCGLLRSCAELREDGAELQGPGRVPPGRGRFLKARSGEAPGATSAQLSASHARSNSVLRKAAQLQSKILSRKKQLELQSAELGRKPLGEDSSSASSLECRARGKKYLKGCAEVGQNVAASGSCSEEEESAQSPTRNVAVTQQLGLGGAEREMRKVTESSLEFSCGRENQRCVTADSRWGRKVNTNFSVLRIFVYTLMAVFSLIMLLSIY